MTIQQIKNKIAELEYWLEHNHSHPDRIKVQADLRELKQQLISKENEF